MKKTLVTVLQSVFSGSIRRSLGRQNGETWQATRSGGGY